MVSSRLSLTGIALLLALAIVPAARGDDTSTSLDSGLLEQVRGLALGKAAELPAHRVEVVVGQLDPRLHLAPCLSIEPYVPPNARLWGKSRIGLRCRQGAVAWNVYLPVTVKVWGKALVLTNGGSAGAVITDGDLAEAEVDLAEEPSPTVAERKELIGRMLAQAVRPGQAVRQGYVKARQWFLAGETVRVLVVGEGFSLESEGQALNNGIEGQATRVRTESGRVLVGQPTGERRMEMSL